jgi:hypothetical protein
LFKEAEITIQVLRKDMHVKSRPLGKRSTMDGEVELHHYLVWNRIDSTSDPFCTKGNSGKFVQLKEGQQFIVFGEDPYGGAKFRANPDDPDDTGEF